MRQFLDWLRRTYRNQPGLLLLAYRNLAWIQRRLNEGGVNLKTFLSIVAHLLSKL